MSERYGTPAHHEATKAAMREAGCERNLNGFCKEHRGRWRHGDELCPTAEAAARIGYEAGRRDALSDALPDNGRALTEDERERMACAWADFRKHYGVSATSAIRAREHRAFKAGRESVVQAEIEYGIVRPSQTPSMSGRPLWVQIVSATFSTREQAERALRNVPSLRDKEYAARVVSRRAPGSWCLVEEGDQP